MRRIAVVTLVALALVGAVASPALAADVAQQDNESDEVNVEETSTTSEESDDQEASSVVAEVDDNIRVTDYSYNSDSEMMTVTFRNVGTGSNATDVTMTEVISERDGNSGQMGVEMFSVRPGETVEVRIYAKSGAVMIVTEQSLERGQGTFIEADESTPFFSGSPTWNYVRLAGIGASIGVVLATLLVAWHVVADGHDKVEVKT